MKIFRIWIDINCPASNAFYIIYKWIIFFRLTYPNTLSEVLVADQHQRVMLRFVVRDTASGRPTEVHQAFVKITHIDSNREIIFVAETDANDIYKFDIVSIISL